KFPEGTEGAFVRLRTNASERRNRRTDCQMARRTDRAKDGGGRSVLLAPRESVRPSWRLHQSVLGGAEGRILSRNVMDEPLAIEQPPRLVQPLGDTHMLRRWFDLS